MLNMTFIKSWNKGFCTWFWDTWFGVHIGDCCEGHDGDCSTKKFYLCLKGKLGKFHASYIGFGGSIGCWVKYTKKMIEYTKNKYSKKV